MMNKEKFWLEKLLLIIMKPYETHELFIVIDNNLWHRYYWNNTNQTWYYTNYNGKWNKNIEVTLEDVTCGYEYLKECKGFHYKSQNEYVHFS